jgi:hypothetical protein
MGRFLNRALLHELGNSGAAVAIGLFWHHVLSSFAHPTHGRRTSDVTGLVGVVDAGCASHYRWVWLFLITHQFSLRVPDLKAVPVDYVMVWAQGFGSFERRFEGLKHLHGMAAVRRDAKRSM